MKIGILGAGKIAHSTVPAMIALDEIECYAVASRDYEKARDFADRYGFQKAYGSYEQMLSDPEMMELFGLQSKTEGRSCSGAQSESTEAHES